MKSVSQELIPVATYSFSPSPKYLCIIQQGVFSTLRKLTKPVSLFLLHLETDNQTIHVFKTTRDRIHCICHHLQQAYKSRFRYLMKVTKCVLTNVPKSSSTCLLYVIHPLHLSSALSARCQGHLWDILVCQNPTPASECCQMSASWTAINHCFPLHQMLQTSLEIRGPPALR